MSLNASARGRKVRGEGRQSPNLSRGVGATVANNQRPGGTAAKSRRFSRVVGLEWQGEWPMFSNSSRSESGTWELPNSSWAIPAITGFVVLLAVAAALA